MRDLRETVWRDGGGAETDGRRQESRIWVAECSSPELNEANGYDHLQVADACLDAIEASRRFILLDTGEQSTQIHHSSAKSSSSFLEMELYQAALLGRPITLIAVGEHTARDSPLAILLRQMMLSRADVRCVYDLSEAREILLKIALGNEPTTATSSKAFLRGNLALARRYLVRWRSRRLFEEPIFLGGLTAGGFDLRARDADIAEHYLTLAESQRSMNRVLSRTWIAMRAMMGAHFSVSRDARFVDLWNRALKCWSRAAAWRGLHGHMLLGMLSASSAQAAMRQRLDLPLYVNDGDDHCDLFTDISSAYYSIAGVMPRSHRREFYTRSEAYIRSGLESRPTEERHTLLPMQGSLELRLGRFKTARQTFKEALAAETLAAANPDKIGFLTAELGWAELYLGHPRTARRMIKEGLTMLTSAGHPGFRSRVLRKHVYACLASLSIGEAKDSARRLTELARITNTYDQLDSVVLRLSGKR
ncbi:MAG: hypothetical protein AAF756_15580 [Pseudomonadota bacterium]